MRLNMSNVKMKKWSSSMICDFVEVYEQFPVLWDSTNVDYKNKVIREESYRKMVDILSINFRNIDVVVVKAKIRSIRNAYTLELHKILKSQRNGAYGDKVYTPLVPWFPAADRFLRQVVAPRSTQYILPPEPENKRKKRNRENAQLQPQQEQLEIKCNLISTDAPTPISENERTTQTDVHESCPIQQAQNTPDEFEAIAINVAAKLRKMAPTQQILAEGLIQTVLQKGIFEELTRFTCLAEENTLVNNCDNLPTTSVTYFDAPVSYSPCSTVESSTVACKQEIIVTNIESLN
ncbi:uncharacterized protein LOC142329171 isoform X2 [Lycorma delicatula]|uniref:uncharacterized protein LOC142329171 isoform X2 n=1 Tax=Lycorma delicatula TaxID=130591 RepID=UPI003F514821